MNGEMSSLLVPKTFLNVCGVFFFAYAVVSPHFVILGITG